MSYYYWYRIQCFFGRHRFVGREDKICLICKHRRGIPEYLNPPPIPNKNTYNMPLTTDPNDPRLSRGGDTEPVKQNEVYLVLSDEERSKGFVRPVRQSYIHNVCGSETKMGLAIAETYARDPHFYGYTYCCMCMKHLPVGEFKWSGTNEIVGS
jgi:hypothetical protein